MSGIQRRSVLAGMLAGGISLAAPVPALAGERGGARGFLARKGLGTGVQLYTVDAMARKDLAGTLMRLAQIGYRNLELAGMHGHEPKAIRAAAADAGLSITGIHLGDADLGTTQQDAARVAEDLSVLGVREVALPMFIFPRDVTRQDGESFTDYLYRAVRTKGAGIWERTADLLNERAAALAPYGLRLSYHNHNVEFATVEGGRTGWDILMERTDPSLVSLELDLGWIAAAGLDPVEFVARHAGRVRQAHVKDIKASTVPNYGFRQDPAEVGAGTIDWDSLLPAAYAAGVRHFYVEQEPPFERDPFTSLARSYAFLAG